MSVSAAREGCGGNEGRMWGLSGIYSVLDGDRYRIVELFLYRLARCEAGWTVGDGDE